MSVGIEGRLHPPVQREQPVAEGLEAKNWCLASGRERPLRGHPRPTPIRRERRPHRCVGPDPALATGPVQQPFPGQRQEAAFAGGYGDPPQRARSGRTADRRCSRRSLPETGSASPTATGSPPTSSRAAVDACLADLRAAARRDLPARRPADSGSGRSPQRTRSARSLAAGVELEHARGVWFPDGAIP